VNVGVVGRRRQAVTGRNFAPRRTYGFRRRSRGRVAAVLVVVALAAACAQDVEEVPEIYRPTNAHDAYLRSLVTANLGSSALARDWIAAAESALREPVGVSSSFREVGYFDESSPAAIGYVFSVTGGQRIEAEVELDGGEPLRLFMDLYRLLDDDPAAPVHVATSAASVGETGEDDHGRAVLDPALGATRRIDLVSLRDGTYVLRIQPELLRSARYTVVVRTDASLAFPVEGRDTGALLSVFGAERDAGRRSHNGADLFAPRGTPVLSATDGVVSRATTTEVGGNVVWVRDAELGMNLYYAHLDSSSVERGQLVRAGDQLGTVGNTGNARTTAPHLHFGVYARGPVDPDPFLRRVDTEPSTLTVELDRLGGWSRIAEASVEVLASPDRRSRTVASAERLAPVRVWGAHGRYYRISLPDGTRGYIVGAASEPVTPLRSESLADVGLLLDRPGPRGAVKEELRAGDSVSVLGSFGNFLYIQTRAGINGWLPIRTTEDE